MRQHSRKQDLLFPVFCEQQWMHRAIIHFSSIFTEATAGLYNAMSKLEIVPECVFYYLQKKTRSLKCSPAFPVFVLLVLWNTAQVGIPPQSQVNSNRNTGDLLTLIIGPCSEPFSGFAPIHFEVRKDEHLHRPLLCTCMS